jgi:hypothetical protein
MILIEKVLFVVLKGAHLFVENVAVERNARYISDLRLIACARLADLQIVVIPLFKVARSHSKGIPCLLLIFGTILTQI